MNAHILLVDDERHIRRAVSEELVAEGYSVESAGTGEEAVRLMDRILPDLVILDLGLPGMSGLDVCREVRSRHPEVRCIMLTSFADDEALFAAIMAGASGYVLKQVRGSDLIDAIRRVGRGDSLIDPALTGRLLERLRSKPEEDELAGLSDQERKILDLIAEGYTNRQIAESIFLAEKTVKNYVSNLLAKLGMSRRTEAAAYAARLTERRRQEPH